MSIASTAQARAAKRSRFIHKRTFLVATRKLLARRGETRPITADSQHSTNKKAKSEALDPGLRRGDESCPNAAPETKAPDAQ
ncbi:MAG: hypothetical protein H6949_17400 [Zoogloeaceae bacterium]|nr:hypothetical protein [Zoogloeaceae bacterium]